MASILKDYDNAKWLLSESSKGVPRAATARRYLVAVHESRGKEGLTVYGLEKAAQLESDDEELWKVSTIKWRSNTSHVAQFLPWI